MATSFIRDSSSSAFALVLAYALVILSLWKVDTGIVGRQSSTVFDSSSVVKTTLAPRTVPDESSSELYRLLASPPEQFHIRLAGNGTEAQNEEVRRLTALSLILYVTEDGIKRY